MIASIAHAVAANILALVESYHRGTTMNYENACRDASSLAGSAAMVLSPIEGEMNRIDNRISQVGDSIMKLREALGMVLRGESPKSQSTGNVPREIEQSVMHARLREYADRLENVNGALEELLSRVTL